MRSVKRYIVQSAAAFCLMMLLVPATSVLAQTGKIAGTVVDAETGNPLPGVNVILVGTQRGATTNADGYYAILNVEPGTYSVRASFIGYTEETVQDVEVNIGLTSTVPFELQPGTVGLEEIVVEAEDRVIQPDVSASRIDISTEDIENLPINDIEAVVALQAGIQAGLRVRGGGRDDLGFRIDGFNMGSSRTNVPYTNISYTSIQQVQVQTGGFNAEYGNIRSGLVNVVTKEGPRNRYTIDVLARYSPAQKKHFGISADNPKSYWFRPFMDPDVRLEGTEDWPDEMENQYPEFEGYLALAENLTQDDNPDNDLSPEQLRQLFLWRHRKPVEPYSPDYVIDGSIGGPVPFVSDYLGDLRFFASYRQEESQYIVPLVREGYDARTGRIKLTTNLAPGIKVNLQQMWGQATGANCTRSGATSPCRFGDRELVREIYGGYNPSAEAFFTPSARSISKIQRRMTALDWTHTLSPNTFYNVKLQRYVTEYDAHPVASGSFEPIKHIGSYPVDEAPYGYWFEARDGEVSALDIGGHTAEFRDTSIVSEWMGSFDITSQVNQYNQVQAGFQFSAAHNDISYGHIDFLINPNDIRASWETTPLYGAAYVQDKIEYLGMIANVGVRVDYLDPNNQWWDYENPYTEAFLSAELTHELLNQVPVEPKWAISPRLGISFPVTETSKLYFNWGEFVQYLEPEMMYMFERRQLTNTPWRIANPTVPMPSTTAYELGYEQSLFGEYLIRIAGYYKDIEHEPVWVAFHGRQGLIEYESNFANQYRDVRGVEISLYKNVGRWFRGFINYTYHVEIEGQFGLPEYFESPVAQANYEATFGANFPFQPVPQPYARISLDFMTPPEFGPQMGSFSPLGDWRLNLLGRWEAGEYFTFTGDLEAPGVIYNMQWENYQMVDARLMKNLNIGGLDAQFYIDVKNLFNIKNFNSGSFEGPRDMDDYLKSLHIPKEMVADIPNFADVWTKTGEDVPGTLGEEYINPPNLRGYRYLFPRRVMYGLRFTF